MEELIELKQENKKLLQKISVLEQELSRYQSSGPVGFYYELNRWVNETNEYMKSQNIATLMGIDDKDKKFDRMMELIKNAKSNIDTIETLKPLLGISGDEKRDKDDSSLLGKDFMSNVAMKRV